MTTIVKPPKGLTPSTYVDWNNRHEAIDIPWAGRSFPIDKAIAPIIFDLWEAGIVTTDCCQDGYIGIDMTKGGVVLSDLSRIIGKHKMFKMFELASLKHVVYCVWDSYMTNIQVQLTKGKISGRWL